MSPKVVNPITDKKSIVVPLRNKKEKQFWLSTALILVAVGNISPLTVAPGIAAIYLPISLLVVLLGVVLNIQTWITQVRHVLLIILVLLFFGLGFLVSPLNPYGQTKLVGVGILILQLLAPAALKQFKVSVDYMFKLLVTIGTFSAVAIVFCGQIDVAGRLVFFGLNPISIGRLSGIVVVIVIATLLTTNYVATRIKIVLVFLAAPCLIAGVQSGSRGPLLGIAIAFVAILFVRWRHLKSWPSLFWLCAIPLGLFFLYRFLTTNEDLRAFSTGTTGRDQLFSQSLDSISQNPLGVGWGNFYLAVPSADRVDEYKVYAHNLFLEVAVEGGWFAFIILSIFIVVTSHRLYMTAVKGNPQALITMALLVFSIVNASVSSDIVGNRFLWFTLGLALVSTAHWSDRHIAANSITPSARSNQRSQAK